MVSYQELISSLGLDELLFLPIPTYKVLLYIMILQTQAINASQNISPLCVHS